MMCCAIARFRPPLWALAAGLGGAEKPLNPPRQGRIAALGLMPCLAKPVFLSHANPENMKKPIKINTSASHGR
jgi:hypothetical protein